MVTRIECLYLNSHYNKVCRQTRAQILKNANKSSMLLWLTNVHAVLVSSLNINFILNAYSYGTR